MDDKMNPVCFMVLSTQIDELKSNAGLWLRRHLSLREIYISYLLEQI